jgi:hypothetical protein
MNDHRPADERFKPGHLVCITKWWKEGDVVPEGWSYIGELNAERVAGCPDCKMRAAGLDPATGLPLENEGERLDRLHRTVLR